VHRTYTERFVPLQLNCTKLKPFSIFYIFIQQCIFKMSRKFESGAQERKKVAEREKFVNKLPRLTSFFPTESKENSEKLVEKEVGDTDNSEKDQSIEHCDEVLCDIPIDSDNYENNLHLNETIETNANVDSSCLNNKKDTTGMYTKLFEVLKELFLCAEDCSTVYLLLVFWDND